MDQNLNTSNTPQVLTQVDTHKVLRNTYWLLSLSLIPTVIGAIVGINLKFQFLPANPFVAFLLFIGIVMGFFWLIDRNKNSSLGLVLLLAFTFFMGLMLSRLLQVALQFNNGGELIMMAGGGTAVVFASIAAFVTITKKDFSFLGNFLFAGLIIAFLAIAATLLFEIPGMTVIISSFCLLLFSGYLLYDLSRIINNVEDNYVMATLMVYIDIYNIFISLLRLLLVFFGDND